MDLICFLITGLFSVGIYFLINIFIQLWIGNSYLLNNVCVIIIVANFYLNSMLQSIETVKSSTGLYYQDRYIPLIQAIINLILSFVLGRQFGLTGILLATTVSYVLTVSWSKAYIIYKYVFHKSIILYLKKQIKNFIILVLTFLMTSLTFKLLFISNLYILFIIKGIIVASYFILNSFIIYWGSSELNFVITLLKNIINRGETYE